MRDGYGDKRTIVVGVNGLKHLDDDGQGDHCDQGDDVQCQDLVVELMFRSDKGHYHLGLRCFTFNSIGVLREHIIS